MARTPQLNERRHGGTAPRSNPALVPGLIALVLIGVAIGAAIMAKKPNTAAQAPKPSADPFADMPPEALPAPRPKKPGSDLPPAPDSIVTEPLWVSAKAIAAEGLVLYEEAMTAKAKNDTTLANAKGREARAKLDEAVTLTAEWEEMLDAKYNVYDGKVIAIRDARTNWFNKLRYLEKSVGH